MLNSFKKLVGTTALATAMLAAASPVTQAATDVTYLLPAPPTSPAFAPWILAKEKGYFEEQGLNVTFISGKGGVDVAKQVGSGNAKVGGAIGETPIIVRANGIPVKAVAVLGGKGVTQIAASEESGITSVADLKGKTVSVMSYSDTTYYALLASLRKAGLGRDDLNIQAAGPAGVWQLFSTGEVDAMAGVPDWVVGAEDTGLAVHLMEENQLAVSLAQAIIASEDAIENDPELVQGIVTGTLKGMHDIVSDPAAAAAAFAKAVPSYSGKEALLEKTFKLYAERVYSDQPKLGVIDQERLNVANDFYNAEGIVSRPTPVDELYTNEFAEKAQESL